GARSSPRTFLIRGRNPGPTPTDPDWAPAFAGATELAPACAGVTDQQAAGTTLSSPCPEFPFGLGSAWRLLLQRRPDRRGRPRERANFTGLFRLRARGPILAPKPARSGVR